MTDTVLAKDRALNAERIARIGREVHAVLPAFDDRAFADDVMQDLQSLELGARISRTAQGLHDHLPVTGPAALEVLQRSLPPTPDAAGITNDFGLHIYSPHSEFVARYYLSEQYLSQALEAMARFTCYFSAEGAVRFFLNAFPEQTMDAVAAWACDADYRVRRLASESTRPALPWSARINLPADAALPVLELLYDDPRRYVTQSVANHLRDIANSDPGLVLATLKRWATENRATARELTFITREALKTTLKQGWPPAYELLGYPPGAPVDVSPISLERDELAEGEDLAFSARLSCSVTVPVHVMYVITSTTAKGARREKVYYLTRGQVTVNQTLPLAKRHHLRSTANTKITPGQYGIAVQVNGRRFPETAFRLH